MIIDTDDYAAAGIKLFTFPGGEWHANVPAIPYRPFSEPITIHAKLRCWDDVGKLLVVADALGTQGHALHLFAPYFPGMRQDRNPNGLTPLTVRVYAEVLLHHFFSVTTVDPHSEAGLQRLIDDGNFFDTTEVKVIYPETFIADLIPEHLRPSHVLIPDKGAAVRSNVIANLFEVPTVQAIKMRDFETGALSGFAVPDGLADAERILIPDDICDGGGTFVGLLGEIRKQTDAPVDLYVTHGIFSKGLRNLAGFDRIYTTDSFYDDSQPVPMNMHYPEFIELLPYYEEPTQ